MLPVMAMAILCIWAVHTLTVSPETVTASSSKLSVFPVASVVAVDSVSALSVFPDATIMVVNAVSEFFVSIEFPIMTADTVFELSVCNVFAKKAIYELSAGLSHGQGGCR